MPDAPTNQPPGRDSLLGKLNQETAGQQLYRADPTGRLLGTVSLFEHVERWTLTQGGNSVGNTEEVQTLLADLERVLCDYSRNIPPNNLLVVQIVTKLQLRMSLQILNFLTTEQKEFLKQFLDYCKRVSTDDMHAWAAVKRFQALMLSGYVARAFSTENADYIAQALSEKGAMA